jgi:hypothetical protein
MASAVFASCLGADHDRCGEGFDYEDLNCVIAKSADEPDGWQPDAGGEIDPDQWIGTACSCISESGSPCDVSGMPMIQGGTISGCDSVPATWSGAERVCQRSYSGELGGASYYANGFCTLMATDCTGDSFLCDIAITGDFEKMQSCPENTVLLNWTVDVDNIDFIDAKGTIFSKYCVPSCETDEDCRNAENDPVLGEQTQYQCVENNGIRFCQDPRNLPDGYTAEAF